MKLNHSAFLFFICFFYTHVLSSSKSSEKKTIKKTPSFQDPRLKEIIADNFKQLTEGGGIGEKAHALLTRQKSNSPRS